MKFSENWLRSLVNPPVEHSELVARLSMAGLEVDSVEPVAGVFSGVVVGEILAAEQHPDADKLKVCQVTNGSDTLQIVCGAPNACKGLKIPLAMVGAKLPGDFVIKQAKLRGVESNGMLCSAKELGLTEDHAGLLALPSDAPVGKDFRDYMGLNDVAIEVDLTPNRGDCLSIRGIAREVGALYNCPVAEIDCHPVVPTAKEATISVDVLNTKACPRYLGRVIRNVDVSKPTPLWMVERLRRAGMRSVDAVVDITNYVMIELGQPLHAFDLAEIDDRIVVRMAHQEEALTLLNGQVVKLRNDTLVIADKTKPLAIAGVMGGEHSGINVNTKDLLLESAFFDPISVAGKARSYGLHTDASHRYERGVDWQLTHPAMERATALLLDIVGGEAGPVIEAVSAHNLPTTTTVVLRSERIKKMLGIELTDKEVEQLLMPLGLMLQVKASGEWQVTIPSYRYDMAIEVDLLEEIARLYGYNRLPVRYPQARLAPHGKIEAELDKKSLRQLLVARGYQEAITYSFIEPSLFKLFNPQQEPLTLANPISADMSAMRVSLWPGLIKALQHNLNRQQDRVRLFEIGLRFEGNLSNLKQIDTIAGLITGPCLPEGWSNSKQLVDFYDIKGDVEAILGSVGALDQFVFNPMEHSSLHPGQNAIIERNNKTIGYVGALHPELAKVLGISQPVYLFELSLTKIKAGQLPKFKELSRFPEVRRDLAILIDKSVIAEQFLMIIKETAGEYLTSMQLFDVYVGKGVDESQKSVAVGLTWQHPERTLTDEEINALLNNIISVLEKQFNATLRN